MRGFVKTLIGDAATLTAAALCILLAVTLLHSALAILAGVVFPISLLGAVAYLARR